MNNSNNETVRSDAVAAENAAPATSVNQNQYYSQENVQSAAPQSQYTVQYAQQPYGNPVQQPQYAAQPTPAVSAASTSSSPLKRVLLTVLAIAGTVTAVFLCICLCIFGARIAFGSISSDSDSSAPSFSEEWDEPRTEPDNGNSGSNQSGGSPGLGITVETLDSTVASRFGLDGGLCIRAFSEVNAFEGTDVQALDIITACEGEPVATTDDLSKFLASSSVGDSLTLTITRFNEGVGETFDVTVKLVDISK